jgi:hypothetical protein
MPGVNCAPGFRIENGFSSKKARAAKLWQVRAFCLNHVLFHLKFPHKHSFLGFLQAQCQHFFFLRLGAKAGE